MKQLVYNKNDLKAYIVNSNDDLFYRGRNLTKKIYSDKFDTKGMKDNYDLGIVMFYKNEIIFNINVALFNNKLPFCKFFKIEDKKIELDSSYFELCGLALKGNKFKHSEYLIFFMLYIVEKHIIPTYELKFMISIQHDYLIQKFHSYNQGVFFEEIAPISILENSLPKDKYWDSDIKPKLYLANYSDPSPFIKNIEKTLKNIDFL